MSNLLPREQISAAITQANENGQVGLVPFVTAGYPDKDAFITTLKAIAVQGNVIEVGA